VLNFYSQGRPFPALCGSFAMLFTGAGLGNAYGLSGVLSGNIPVPEDFFDYPQRLIHGNIAYLMLALVALHFGAAMYHQFIRKDNLLSRMWFGKR